MSQIDVSKLKKPGSAAGVDEVGIDYVVQGTAKAWGNLDGTDTISLKKSFNVTSITDVAEGEFKFNYANAMADADYCFSISTEKWGAGQNTGGIDAAMFGGVTAGSIHVYCARNTNSAADDPSDPPSVCFSNLGDLA